MPSHPLQEAEMEKRNTVFYCVIILIAIKNPCVLPPFPIPIFVFLRRSTLQIVDALVTS